MILRKSSTRLFCTCGFQANVVDRMMQSFENKDVVFVVFARSYLMEIDGITWKQRRFCHGCFCKTVLIEFDGITENKEDFVLVVFDEAREISTCCFPDFDPEWALISSIKIIIWWYHVLRNILFLLFSRVRWW